jgi:NADH dehydrogenase FAD-containing subunit
MKKTRVVIVGGGFGGLYAALEFEKWRYTDIEVTLISEENFSCSPRCSTKWRRATWI